VYLNLFERIGTDLQSILNIPCIPGVYRFINDTQEILYIGASGNLQKRVSQYFRVNSSHDQKQRKIKQRTRFIEYKGYNIVEAAFEAERIEIWTNQPELNIRGNGVHSFSYLIVRNQPFSHFLCYDEDNFSKITPDDEFFRINTHLRDLREKLEIIRRRLPFCIVTSERSCWDYQINLCENNCREMANDPDSRRNRNVHTLISELISKESTLISKWKTSIIDYSSKLQFERARKLNTALEALESLRCSFGGQCSVREIDQFSFTINNQYKKNISVQIRSFLYGKNIVRKNELIKSDERFTTEILVLYFLMKYYRDAGSLPNEVLINYSLSQKLQNQFHKRIRRFYHRSVGLRIIA
jgi:excinuclease ABC subunit C